MKVFNPIFAILLIVGCALLTVGVVQYDNHAEAKVGSSLEGNSEGSFRQLQSRGRYNLYALYQNFYNKYNAYFG